MPAKQERTPDGQVKDENVAAEETLRETPFSSPHQPGAEEAPNEEKMALEPPTLHSLEERVDELEARLAAIESLEPVRGEQDGLQIDRAAQKKARE